MFFENGRRSFANAYDFTWQRHFSNWFLKRSLRWKYLLSLVRGDYQRVHRLIEVCKQTNRSSGFFNFFFEKTSRWFSSSIIDPSFLGLLQTKFARCLMSLFESTVTMIRVNIKTKYFHRKCFTSFDKFIVTMHETTTIFYPFLYESFIC